MLMLVLVLVLVLVLWNPKSKGTTWHKVEGVVVGRVCSRLLTLRRIREIWKTTER